MGVLNVTPDSFFDGGKFIRHELAIAHGLRLVEEGADIIDVGGESTRPGAAPVDETEELRRVAPVIEGLAKAVRVPISIDTMKPAVAKAALSAGASIVNDISANSADDRVGATAAESGAAYICMHMQGTPQTMQLDPRYDDVVAEVREFFFQRIQRLKDCGIGHEQLIFDPGIGFGKTLEHNLELLRALGGFSSLERPILLGVSRKGFIGRLLGTPIEERLPAALACACLAVEAGVQMIRTHDVAATVQAVRMTEAILAGGKKNVANH
jgi:dihydropteroate synthase